MTVTAITSYGYRLVTVGNQNCSNTIRDVKILPYDFKLCDHSGLGKKPGPKKSLVDENGTVCYAEWTKPCGTVVKVAIKTFKFKVSQLAASSSSGFENIFV